MKQMKEVVSMLGRITIDNADRIRCRLADALRSKPVLVVVDLSDVPYMDTSGLATLMEAMRTARRQGTRLVLCGVQEQPRYLLRVTDLDHIFEIEKDKGA
jgi:anti-sigma B factor antagonist